jgi:hypothetical protein
MVEQLPERFRPSLYQRQKTVRHVHHLQFLATCQRHDVVPTGLKIKSRPQIHPVSPSFRDEWEKVLKDTSNQFIQLLIGEHKRLLKDSQKQEEVLWKSVLGLPLYERVKACEIINTKSSELELALKRREKKKLFALTHLLIKSLNVLN